MSGDTSRQQKFAQTFMDSCLETWFQTETGLAPEIWSWNPKTLVSQRNAKDGENSTNDIWSKITDVVGGKLKKRNRRGNETQKKRAVAADNGDFNSKQSQRPFKIASSVYGLRPGTVFQ